MKYTRKNIMLFRAAVLSLVFVLLFAASALADDVTSWSALKDKAEGSDALSNNSSDVTQIKLTSNLTANSTVNIAGSDWQGIRYRNIEIDLNGYKVTRGSNHNGSLFSVGNYGTLTIKDSKNPNVNEAAVSPANGPSVAGSGSPASFSDSTLTYYVTKSTVTGVTTTTEQRYKMTVLANNAGQIDASDSRDPIFNLNGAHAKLNIQGGMIYGSNNRAVYAQDGAEVAISGGYIFDNHARNGNGGAVYVQGNGEKRAKLTVSGSAVLAGNSAKSGGAVAAMNQTDVTISGGVLSGNYAAENGGAVYLDYDAIAAMSGGSVTHNWVTSNNYDHVGGGILVFGKMTLSGGQVTANAAGGGGGISTLHWKSGSFLMTNGIVAGNIARVNEGGGITINGNGRGAIVAGYITNNKTLTTQHWGGGGIFCADSGVLTMRSVLITGNTAGGYGGGLAGCSTGRIDTHETSNGITVLDHSVAVYDNSASGTQLSGSESTKSEDRVYAANDPVFTRDKGAHYQDYFCALNTTVCASMLGGDSARWSGTLDGKALAEGTMQGDDRLTSQYVTGLTAHPEDNSKTKAVNAAHVFVTGNTSGTHGGGILCNGYLIIGTHRKMNIGDRMTIKGQKTLYGGSLSRQYAFDVHQVSGDNRTLVTTGTSNLNGEIQFLGRLPFDEAGTYVFEISENTANLPADIIADPTVYRMTVQVSATHSTVTNVDPTDVTKTETIKVTFNKISHISIQKYVDGKPGDTVATYTNIDSHNNKAYELPYLFQFTNRIDDTLDTGIVVSKTVHNLTNTDDRTPFTFRVVLNDKTVNGKKGDMSFSGGVATFTLIGGQSKRALGLPAGVSYTVTETAVDGYYNANPQKLGEVVQDQIHEVDFENLAVGSLKISKTLQNDPGVDMQRKFDFTITLVNQPTLTGRHGDVYFENGVATVELAHGQSVTAKNLPAGTQYTVTEMAEDGYTPEQPSFMGEIETGETKTASFVNKRDVGSLTVRKVVEGGEDGQEFEFEIELIDSPHIHGNFGGVTFDRGVAKFKLKNGQSVTASGIPTGIPYRVRETHNGDYYVSVTGPDNGTIAKTPRTVTFTNTKFSGLAISKTTTGTVYDREKNFKFRIELKVDGKEINVTYKDVLFEDGVATIELRNGESFVLANLPDGMTYTVTEVLNDDEKDKYLTWVNGAEGTSVSGELSAGESAHADFANYRRVGKLQISKTVESPLTIDKTERVFGFEVEMSEPINGRFGDITFSYGKATVYLKHGQTLTAINLPYGMTYTITEIPDPQFTAVAQKTGTIPKNDTAVVNIVNERIVGDLTVKKSVRGAKSDELFGFKVILDRQITGEFGQMRFTDGVAEFTMKAGETRTARNLPDGVNFKVTETMFNAKRYVPLVYDLYGDIDAQNPAVVEFVNIEQNGLMVTKTIEGSAADMKKRFAFRVELSDKTINGVYGDMTFAGGVAEIELGHGESAYAMNFGRELGYTVTELNAEDYVVKSVNASGKIPQHGMAAAEFVNVRDFVREEIPQTGDNSELALCIAALALSCSGLVALAVKRRRA